MEEIWVEKYRPRSLDDVIGQEAITQRLKAYTQTGQLPHLLFAGPPGTGKTTSAVAIAREFFGDDYRANFMELNASDSRGIDIMRSRKQQSDTARSRNLPSIKDFARTPPIGDADFRIIFLDEADSLTDDAQAALRRTMEQYAQHCRFILGCNYSSRIISPIQSRCAVFRFRPLGSDDIKKALRRVAQTQKLEITQDGLEALLYASGGDMRKAINTLQIAAASGGAVDEDSVFAASAVARPEDVRELLQLAVGGDFLKARDRLDELLVNQGLSGEDVIKQIHREVYDLTVPDDVKVRLVDRVGEADFRLVEGANERIQIEALLAHFALTGKGLASR